MSEIHAIVGTYVHWVANRMFKGWNTYGIITVVKGYNITIKTFDDFEETTISLNGEAFKDEITLATKDDAQRYIEDEKLDLTYTIGKLNQRIAELNKKLENLNKIVI